MDTRAINTVASDGSYTPEHGSPCVVCGAYTVVSRETVVFRYDEEHKGMMADGTVEYGECLTCGFCG